MYKFGILGSLLLLVSIGCSTTSTIVRPGDAFSKVERLQGPPDIIEYISNYWNDHRVVFAENTIKYTYLNPVLQTKCVYIVRDDRIVSFECKRTKVEMKWSSNFEIINHSWYQETCVIPHVVEYNYLNAMLDLTKCINTASR
jgi:hypothetical protein